MKRLFIFNIALLSIFNTYSQNIEFNDPVFKEKLIFLGIDSDGDHEISFEEAKIVNKVEIEEPYLEPSITDLSGIEYFENLDTLVCRYHDLKKVILNNNIKLIHLDLSGNYRLDTLKIDSLLLLESLNVIQIGDSINFSFFTELRELYIDNKSNLDVSKNSNLEILYTYMISNIDVTNNLKLKSLECNNQTSLDLSNNSELEYLSCIAISYIENPPKLNELDLSKNLKLRVLDCSWNNLTRIDLSKNTELESFNGYWNQFDKLDFNQNTKLRYLNCAVGYLDTLDLSMNIELDYISCENNMIKELNLSNNRNVEYLFCGRNQMDSLDITKCQNLIKIYCSFNNFTHLNYCNNTKLESIQMVENPFLKYVLVWKLPFPPNDLVLNDWGCPNLKYIQCAVSKNELLHQSIKVYPNPIADYILLDFESNNQMVTIIISNTIGQVVFQKTYRNTNTVRIDFANFEQGIYVINIIHGNSFITKKIVKK